MKQKRSGFAKKWLAGLVLACLLVFNPVAVLADDVDNAVLEARNGILQVYLSYNSQDGVDYFLQGGTGFLVNDSTIITCDHVVTPDNDVHYMAVERWGENYKDRLQIKVVLMRDMYIEASIKNSSSETDFAILSLSTPIYDRTPLKIADSDAVQQTDAVYALGFPAIVTQFGDASINTFNTGDVTVESGSVTKVMSVNGTDMLQNNAKLSDGNSGGPLVNGNGAVVGVNKGVTEEGFYYAIAINQVAKALDALGIVYEKEGEVAPPVEVTPPVEIDGVDVETTANKSGLTATINEAKTRDTSLYTDESVAAFRTALAEAEAAQVNTDITQEAVDAAEQKLTNAALNLTEKSGGIPPLVIYIGIGVLVAAVVIILIVLLVGRKKPAAVPAQPIPSIPGVAPTPGPLPPHAPAQQPQYPANAYDEAGTTVLSGEVDGTVVLNGGGQQAGTLKRRSNGELVSIDRPEYVIGKARDRVNYYIPDNGSISRTHAKITVRGGVCYVTDLNTTNYTFVNGKKIAAGQETQLNNGDILRLADEEFEFSAL